MGTQDYDAKSAGMRGNEGDNDTLTLGLSPEDTIAAHIRLGDDWSLLNGEDEATMHYDSAFQLTQRYREKIDPVSLSTFFSHISAGYLSQANTIRHRDGLDKCFTYLDVKERLLNGWASPVFYLELGNIYDEQYPFDFDKIRFYFAKAAECAALDDNDHAAVRTAKEHLRIIEKQEAYFATRPHLPAISQRPQKKNYGKVAVLSGSGVILLLAGVLARPYIRIDALHRPAPAKAPGPVAAEKAITRPLPPPMDREVVRPVIPAKTPMNMEKKTTANRPPRAVEPATRRRSPIPTIKRSRPRVNVTVRVKTATNRKAPRKSFAPPSREDF